MTIAIALTGILLAVLFKFLVSSAQFNHTIEKASSTVLQRQRIQQRLDTVFTNLESLPSGEANFYTDIFPDESLISLVIYFNAGIDPDPDYSHAVIGRLYVTEEKEFVLSYWSRTNPQHRIETLITDVRDIQWQFLGKPNEKTARKDLIGDHWAWLREWSQTRGGMPQIIRLQLWCGIDKKKQKEPNLQFAFILPAQEPIVMI